MRIRDLQSNEQKLNELLLDRTEQITAYEELFNSQKLSEEGERRFKYALYSCYFELALSKYSLGFSLFDIESDVEASFSFFMKRYEIDEVFTSLDGTDRFLGLISLLILLNKLDDKKPQLLAKLNEYNKRFSLCDYILSSTPISLEQNKYSDLELKYAELIEAASSCDKTHSLIKLEEYTKGWYQSRRSAHWWGQHKSNKTTGYFGYWCLEAAAIAKLKGLELTNTNLGEFFPYSFFGLPEQLPKAQSTIKKGNSNQSNTVAYPALESLTFALEDIWLNESEQRLSLITHDEGLECAGTVYLSDENTLDSFASGRYEALMKHMPWYKRVGVENERNLPIGIVKEQLMQGVWKGETEVTSYLVYALKFDKYFMGLTFTFMEKDKTHCLPIIERLLESIRYE